MSTISAPTKSRAGRVALLVAGDVVAFLAFAALGRESHGMATGLAAVGETVVTAAPFVAGWLAVAPWFGAFKPTVTSSPTRMLRTTALAWPLALVAGSLVRALVVGRVSPWSFYVVTFLVLLLFLVGWRGIFAFVERRMP